MDTTATPKLTETSRNLFLDYANDAGNWNGMPLLGGNCGGDLKAERGNLTQLKRAGLVTTVVDADDRTCTWICFTDAGIAYAATLGVDLAWIRER